MSRCVVATESPLARWAETQPAVGTCLWSHIIIRDCHLDSPVTLQDPICATHQLILSGREQQQMPVIAKIIKDKKQS